MTPDQLTRYLESRGLADTDGIRRNARFRRCAWCKEPTLQGLDADVAGMPVIVDVGDLDVMAEAAVVLTTGERTYTVYELADRIHIEPRFVEQMRAAVQDRPVVKRHTCGVAIPYSSVNRWRIPAHVPELHKDAPPF